MPLGARRRKLKGAFFIGLVVGAVTALLAFTRPSFTERGEFWSFDPRARDAAHIEDAAKDIVLVTIDEADIMDLERNSEIAWPWPRAVYGYLTRYLAMGQPKAIVFDWFFQGRGALGNNDASEFADAMRESGRTVIGLPFANRRDLAVEGAPGRWAVAVQQLPDRRAGLAAAAHILATMRRPILVGAPPMLYVGGTASAAEATGEWQRLAAMDELAELFPKAAAPEGAEPTPPTPPAARELTPEEMAGEITNADVIDELARIDLAPAAGTTPDTYSTLDPPYPVLALGAARLGSVTQHTDLDGTIRRYSPVVVHGGRSFPSLALAAYLVAHPKEQPRFEPGALVLGEHGERKIRLDEHGTFVLRYHGGNRGYAKYRSYELLRSYNQLSEHQTPAVPAETFKDKYVVIAPAAEAMVDFRPSPLEHLHLGALINATALDNLIHGDTIRRMPRWLDALLAFVLVLVLSVGMVAVWTAIPNSVLAFAATIAATGLMLFGYWLWADRLFVTQGIWVAVTTPVGGSALATFGSLLVASALERGDKRFIEKALNRYTSKALTTQLMHHPEYLALGGEKREISVYFSDIAGFTSISEGLTPEALVRLLNEYLTVMTDIIDRYDGYLDKYIGDAVMAFWGGLVPDAEHARKAVLAGVEMRNACVARAEDWKARYGFQVMARSGLNSGHGVVGNMGSQNKYNYTAMGDMVNIASRLEGANKAYGTLFMVSDSTWALVKDVVDGRDLDLMTVKGKELPIGVYEVLDAKGRTAPEILAAVERFHEGLRLYRAQDFTKAIGVFESALTIRPDDGPSKTYIKRCQHFLAEPPPANWDGVWHMKEK